MNTLMPKISKIKNVKKNYKNNSNSLASKEPAKSKTAPGPTQNCLPYLNKTSTIKKASNSTSTASSVRQEESSTNYKK